MPLASAGHLLYFQGKCQLFGYSLSFNQIMSIFVLIFTGGIVYEGQFAFLGNCAGADAMGADWYAFGRFRISEFVRQFLAHQCGVALGRQLISCCIHGLCVVHRCW